MTVNSEPDHTQNQEVAFGRSPEEVPFGLAPALLGLRAADALYDLCDVPTWTEDARGRWRVSDRRAFYGWLQIEGDTPEAQTALGNQDEDSLERLNDILHKYHSVMPYDEAERFWLFVTACEAQELSFAESFHHIRKQEARIVSAGLRRVVYGRELLGRWWSWRRDTDQFSGQGTVDTAREALRELITMVAPYHLTDEGH
jgi:hypothetical protein